MRRARVSSLAPSLLAMACGCLNSPTDPPKEQPDPPGPSPYIIWEVDTYVGDGVASVYWDATPIFMPFTPLPEAFEARLEVSNASANGPYRIVASSRIIGPDSAVVRDLNNGILHYFRIVSCDAEGRAIGMSRVLETIPGPAPTPLIEIPAFQREYASRSLTWSPRGDRLAFVKADGCVKANLYAYDFTTSSILQMTHFAEDEQSLSHAGWSADGSTIVFQYTPSRTNYLLDYRIWTFAVGDESTHNVTSGRFDGTPAWLTAREIAFVRYTNSPRAPEIHRLALGTPPVTTPLTSDGKIWKTDLAVSRDGLSIAYSGVDYDSQQPVWSLYVVSTSGGPSHKLTDARGWEDRHPSWHPDGRTLYFASKRSGHYEIWTLDVDSGTLHQVTRSQVRYRAHYDPVLDTGGSKLACFASRGSPTNILVLAIGS